MLPLGQRVGKFSAVAEHGPLTRRQKFGMVVGMAAKRIATLREMGVSAANAKALDRMMTEARSARDVDATLDFANKVLDGHGVEAIRGMWHDRYYQDIVALYVNMGDAYNFTVIYDAVDGKFIVKDYGDFVERKSEEYEIM